MKGASCCTRSSACNTPPLNPDEQDKCMRPRTSCWRDASIKCTKAAAEAYSQTEQAAAS